MLSYDLSLIASTFERDADEIERCPPTPDRKRQAAAVRKCAEELRRPGIAAEQALASITTACRIYSGAK